MTRRAFTTMTCLALAVLLGGARPAFAQPTVEDELLACFDQNASVGYERAIVLFDQAAKRGDVDGMMAVLRVPMSLLARLDTDGKLRIETTLYCRPLDTMAAAAAAAAEGAGRWELLGEARTMQGTIAATWGTIYPFPGLPRVYSYMRAADEAFARAGAQSAPMLVALRAWLEGRGSTEEALQRDWEGRVTKLGELGELGSIVDAMMRAAFVLSDSEAVAIHGELVERLRTEQSEESYASCGSYAAWMLAVPGTEAMIPVLRQVVDERGDSAAQGTWAMVSTSLGGACWNLWFGRDDIYRETGYWPRRHYKRAEWVSFEFCHSAPKLAQFGRETEAVAMAEFSLRLLLEAPPPRAFRGAVGSNDALAGRPCIHPPRDLAPHVRGLRTRQRCRSRSR